MKAPSSYIIMFCMLNIFNFHIVKLGCSMLDTCFVQTDVNKTQSAAMFTIHGGATGYRYAGSGLKEWVLVIRCDKSDERWYGKCQVAGHLDITITASRLTSQSRLAQQVFWTSLRQGNRGSMIYYHCFNEKS